MNTDLELEKALLGTWKWPDHRSGVMQEFTFKPDHKFSGRVGADRVFGYWDVKERQFRMGPTKDEVERTPIRLDDDEVVITSPSGKVERWLRQIL